MMAKNEADVNSKRYLKRFYYTVDQAVDKPFNWKQLIRLLKYLKPYSKTYLPGALIAMLVSTAVRLAVPIIIGQVAFNVAIENKDGTMLTYLVLFIGFLYILNYIGNILRIKWVNILGQNVIYDLRKHLFTHVQRLSHRFFDKRSEGSILVRIMNDITS